MLLFNEIIKEYVRYCKHDYKKATMHHVLAMYSFVSSIGFSCLFCANIFNIASKHASINEDVYSYTRIMTLSTGTVIANNEHGARILSPLEDKRIDATNLVMHIKNHENVKKLAVKKVSIYETSKPFYGFIEPTLGNYKITAISDSFLHLLSTVKFRPYQRARYSLIITTITLASAYINMNIAREFDRY